MTDRLRIPKGRPTIRKGGSLTGLHGPKSRPIKLWPFGPKPNTTIERLEQAYMTGLGAVDQIEEHTRKSTASGKLTADGVKDDALQFAINNLVPNLQRARPQSRRPRQKLLSASRSSRSTSLIGQTSLERFGEWKSALFFVR